MSGAGCVCVFAKAPVPGLVKTRLAPVLGDGAAEIAAAFLVDTWRALRRAGGARPVLALDGALDPSSLELQGVEIWPQGGGDLGARIERILRRALQSAPWAVALGADAPGLPRGRLEAAFTSLTCNDSVIGPCDDGGFYLLGLRRCPEGLLADLPWSEPTTFAATVARLAARGLQPFVLEPWFDVDLPADLDRLAALLARGEVIAPATARALAARGLLP